MMSTYRTSLLAASAASALVVGLAAQQAAAFDEVDWSWTLNASKTIDERFTVSVSFDPDNLVTIEDFQIFIGDAKAESSVTGVHVSLPSDNGNQGGTVSINENIGVSGTYDDTLDPDAVDSVTFNPNPAGGLTFSLVSGGPVDEGDDTFEFTFNVSGNVTVPATPGDDAFDALVYLGNVNNNTTAVGNNASITVPEFTALNIHEGQFVFDSAYNGGGGLNHTDIPGALVTGLVAYGLYQDDLNSSYVIGGTATVAAALGIIDPATISAKGTVNDIINASVDNAATAVANNKSITVEIGEDSRDNVMVADLTQFAYANVSATSNTSNVSLSNFTNLNPDLLGRNIVQGGATAVGNNLSINVGVPDLDD